MKEQIYLNRTLIFALIMNYSYHRCCISTTDWDLVFFGFITVISVIFLLINIGLLIYYHYEK